MGERLNLMYTLNFVSEPQSQGKLNQALLFFHFGPKYQSLSVHTCTFVSLDI